MNLVKPKGMYTGHRFRSSSSPDEIDARNEIASPPPF